MFRGKIFSENGNPTSAFHADPDEPSVSIVFLVIHKKLFVSTLGSQSSVRYQDLSYHLIDQSWHPPALIGYSFLSPILLLVGEHWPVDDLFKLESANGDVNHGLPRVVRNNILQVTLMPVYVTEG